MRSSITMRWSRSAGPRSSSRPGPLAAANTPRSPDPSSAASRSRRRVGSGSRSILAWYNVRSSRLEPDVTVVWPLSRWPPADAANSSKASGLPCASSTTPPQDAGRQVHELARQQLHRLRLGQWRDGELRQSGALEESADTRPDRTEEPDPAAAQPPTDEPDHGTARTIQPVQVVDDDEQRCARRRLTEQRQRCAQHREAVRCRAGTDAERNLEHHTTAPWHASQIVGQRIDELVEAGEADVRLVLHAAATGPRGHRRSWPSPPPRRAMPSCRHRARPSARASPHQRRPHRETNRGPPTRGRDRSAGSSSRSCQPSSPTTPMAACSRGRSSDAMRPYLPPNQGADRPDSPDRTRPAAGPAGSRPRAQDDSRTTSSTLRRRGSTELAVGGGERLQGFDRRPAE